MKLLTRNDCVDAWNYNTDLHIGFFPSLAQSLALGSGYAQEVPYYVKSWPWPTRISHRTVVDPKGRSAWLSCDSTTPVDRPRGLGSCVWRAHGVWDWDEQKQSPVVLQKDYFDRDHRPGREGNRIEWYRDCYAPFVLKFSQRVSRRYPAHLSFVEPLPNQFLPPWQPEPKQDLQQQFKTDRVIDLERPQSLVYAPHFYDLNVLFSKIHTAMSVNVQGLARGMFILNALYFGAQGLRKNYRAQLRNLVLHAEKFLGPIPIVIGEVGIPFDINGREALTTGNYDKQRELLHALISAMEDNFVGFTLWNYNPTNTIEHGDGWNDEDFSVVTCADVTDYRNQLHEGDELYRGARCVDVVIRPYAVKVAGEPVRSEWDPRTLRFEFEWQSSSEVEPKTSDKHRLTEIFLPDYHYGSHELRVEVSSGLEWSVHAEKQSLFVLHPIQKSASTRHRVVVTIRDLDSHLLRRVEQRRLAIPSGFPLNVIPTSLEARLESITLNQWLFSGSVVVALAAAVATVFKA